MNIKYTLNINSKVLESDNIEDVVNYVEVIDLIKKVLKSKRYNLLENLLMDIQTNLKKTFNFNSLNIKISKNNKYISNEIDSMIIGINNE